MLTSASQKWNPNKSMDKKMRTDASPLKSLNSKSFANIPVRVRDIITLDRISKTSPIRSQKSSSPTRSNAGGVPNYLKHTKSTNTKNQITMSGYS